MNSPCENQISSPSEEQMSSTAYIVGANEDLITEILLCLPARSVVKFKLVSTRWLSLISDPNFVLRHSRRHYNRVSGFILGGTLGFRIPMEYTYFSLDQESTMALEFSPNDPYTPGPITLLDSCSGLLLCNASACFGYGQQLSVPCACKIYVFNPIAQQFSTLPLPPVEDMILWNFKLVYDPSRSPFYLVIGVQLYKPFLKIHLYSSDTRVWETITDYWASYDGDRQSVPDDKLYDGVYCNGAIHWVSYNGNVYRLSVDQKCLQKSPRLPLPEHWDRTNLKYFGESQGNLYLIAFDNTKSPRFIVYEMESDCSGWFIKYSLDTSDILAAFPEDDDVDYHNGHLMEVEEVKVEGLNLVMCKNDRFISHNFRDHTFKELPGPFPPLCQFVKIFKYTESLSYI